MLVTMFLGLAMNITPAYLLTAVIAAPVMIGMGITPMAAHLFILFYAAMATMTPPVAMTAFVAATIAEAPPMRVGFLSMRIAFPSFILPFVFAYSPQMLMVGSFREILPGSGCRTAFGFADHTRNGGLVSKQVNGYGFAGDFHHGRDRCDVRQPLSGVGFGASADRICQIQPDRAASYYERSRPIKQ